MTVLVAALNHNGIALAADSAETDPEVGKKEAHYGATKIIPLSDMIAVMTAGAGHYAGIPWETIIHLYQATNPNPTRTVKTTAQQFIDWLPSELEEKYGLLARTRETDWDRPITPADSELLFAGFGTHQLLPALTSRHIRVEPTEGKATFPKEGHWELTQHQTGLIRSAAQDEQVRLFLEGSDPDYLTVIRSALPSMDDLEPLITIDTDHEKAKKIVEAIRERVTTYSNNYAESNRVQLERSTISLPVERLATIAESLVSLTGLWHETRLEVSTVGGPIDVATITRVNGLVWIKRK